VRQIHEYLKPVSVPAVVLTTMESGELSD
jgi:hypothetical protein